jgi:hypothetical protein
MQGCSTVGATTILAVDMAMYWRGRMSKYSHNNNYRKFLELVHSIQCCRCLNPINPSQHVMTANGHHQPNYQKRCHPLKPKRHSCARSPRSTIRVEWAVWRKAARRSEVSAVLVLSASWASIILSHSFWHFWMVVIAWGMPFRVALTRSPRCSKAQRADAALAALMGFDATFSNWLRNRRSALHRSTTWGLVSPSLLHSVLYAITHVEFGGKNSSSQANLYAHRSSLCSCHAAISGRVHMSWPPCGNELVIPPTSQPACHSLPGKPINLCCMLAAL